MCNEKQKITHMINSTSSNNYQTVYYFPWLFGMRRLELCNDVDCYFEPNGDPNRAFVWVK